MMRLVCKLVVFLIAGILSISSISAKDSISLLIEFGAIGAEKTYYSSSSISKDTISMPYTKTTFNPTVYFGGNFPIVDVNENCFLELMPDIVFHGIILEVHYLHTKTKLILCFINLCLFLN